MSMMVTGCGESKRNRAGIAARAIFDGATIGRGGRVTLSRDGWDWLSCFTTRQSLPFNENGRR